MERGIKRWVVNISQWNPTQYEFSFILSILPLHEHSSITRYVKFEDRKRAIVSRLLQYALVHEVFKVPFDEIRIKRTIEGKPYLETDGENMEFPNFNFNVSHHGDYVAIASEPQSNVGIDMVSLVIPKRETALKFIKNFSSYLTTFEWDNIVNAGTCSEILEEFYRYWCVKEAFVKATGDGLGFKLDRLEFHHTNWTNIFVKIDGEISREWTFLISELPKSHWVCVAKGHPKSDIKNNTKTLQLTELLGEQENPSSMPHPSFVLLSVEELLPVSFRVS
ncbi:L-aminoadipate-semialdehyde dehydrogenase-phosphopantetheinyl transferase-like isoform X2 [Papaver somniferum]|uniref:L-aminoadipate-semialdehyde dehydrogenase-phosphopantetheinyl transferase-like isoform X2 n=1 Tax=Papaver somniferum TaxID=3469 RepID=UPI000E6FA9C8|nr:L-aminoadipate-semialdehyde dehydrogenase-phosphopantetheinyl transferase-like isoform X2 [Papaver somniferum]